MTRTRRWIREHDDRLSFVVLYIGGAILLSIWLNLFWVAMLMLGHFVLEIVRGRLLETEQPLLHALWEVKLDIALVLFALVVALYAEHVFALLGLGQAARAGQAARGLQLATRFGVIERALRILVLTMDDIARLVQAGIKLQRRNASEPPPLVTAGEASALASEDEAITTGDVLSLSFGALCLLLILFMPAIVGTPAEDVARQILHELSPAR